MASQPPPPEEIPADTPVDIPVPSPTDPEPYAPTDPEPGAPSDPVMPGLPGYTRALSATLLPSPSGEGPGVGPIR